jgi:hypothetical protein
LPSLKLCRGCGRELPISDFYNPPSGRRSRCKKCDNEYSRAYRLSHPEIAKKSRENYVRHNPRRIWVTACLKGHRKNGFLIELASGELYEVVSKTESCFICGTRLDWQLRNKGHPKHNSPTLDRLNNERTIRIDNILILCYKCNATKRNRTLREFWEYCSAVDRKFHSHFEYPQLVHL